MSPLQLVSSGLIPASDLSDGVGDTGGLELVLPNRMTLPGTIGVIDDKASLKLTSPDGVSEMVAAVGEDATVPAAGGCPLPFFKAAELPPFCSW